MKPLITLDQITLRVGTKALLPGTSWTIREGEHWAVLGPNGSGKSSLVKALWGGTPLKKGTITYHFLKNQNDNLYEHLRRNIGYVSFELHQTIIKQEQSKAENREYSGKQDEITTAREIINSTNAKAIAIELGITNLLDSDVTTLSTGEMRKVLLARAFAKKPRLMILDEPFDGLDGASRKQLRECIEKIMPSITVILVTHRTEEILHKITRVLKLDIPIPSSSKKKSVWSLEHTYSLSSPFITMKSISITYGNKGIIQDLTWEVNAGEHWVIVGPNGSGKSTLLKLITADHPQAYSNDITLFGMKRGSGESIWEIKKHIGIVSADIQLHYLHKATGHDVILSGLFDSMGLFRRATPEEHEQAREVADFFAISHLLDQNFSHCSNGQKRMLLLARALIKKPPLLILDEPCHGLDETNRTAILKMIEHICSTNIALIMSTHHTDEIVPGVSNILEYKKGKFIARKR